MCEHGKLPDERKSIVHHFNIGGVDGYLLVGLYEDGLPGEILVKIAKQGSSLMGFMDALLTMTSIALQNGAPLEDIVRKMCHMHFEPEGYTAHPKIPYALSLVDYIGRWLAVRFLDDLSIIDADLPPRQSKRIDVLITPGS